MSRQSAVVVCPGRGVYGRDELGYLSRFHAAKSEFLSEVDAHRESHGREPVRALDGREKYAASLHASSKNASALIYAAALADYQDIDRDRFDVVAVTGNSMGWYLALAAAGAVRPEDAIAVVDGMGALMEENGVGGQLVYPLVDDQWRPDTGRRSAVEAAVADTNENGEGRAFVSIRLGGMVVLAGDDAGLAALEARLPAVDERYPMRLVRHAAFHTPLLAPVSAMAKQTFPASLFQRPTKPLIDGRGVIHQPAAPDRTPMWDYTFGRQITETFDFSKALEVAIKEFAPDRLIVLGPGKTLGAPVAQELIRGGWRGMTSKKDFLARQKRDPLVLAMGYDDQRAHVVASARA